MLKIFICNFFWLAEYQYKGVLKFNLSDLVKQTQELKNSFHNEFFTLLFNNAFTLQNFSFLAAIFLVHFQQK